MRTFKAYSVNWGNDILKAITARIVEEFRW
jgi:hypothetical protein